MRADEGDDQVYDCQDEADAENQAITPHLIARANDQCLPQLLIHIRRVQFNGQVQFVEPLEERAEAAHVAHAFRSDDGVAVVKLEHQHQFAWRILAGSQDDTADIGEGITQFFVFLAQQDDKRIGIEPQFLAQTVADPCQWWCFALAGFHATGYLIVCWRYLVRYLILLVVARLVIHLPLAVFSCCSCCPCRACQQRSAVPSRDTQGIPVCIVPCSSILLSKRLSCSSSRLTQRRFTRQQGIRSRASPVVRRLPVGS